MIQTKLVGVLELGGGSCCSCSIVRPQPTEDVDVVLDGQAEGHESRPGNNESRSQDNHCEETEAENPVRLDIFHHIELGTRGKRCEANLLRRKVELGVVVH